LDELRHILLEQTLVYNKSELKPLRTKKGLLMGLPFGWTILSLLHIHIVETVLKETKTRKSNVIVKILGDDLVALWPESCATLYNAKLAAWKLPISIDKHLVSKKYGNFARKFLRISTRKVRLYDPKTFEFREDLQY
jgi:hypothetical protein